MADLVLSYTDAAGEPVEVPVMDVEGARRFKMLREMLGGRDFTLTDRATGSPISLDG